jgi:eukaryotic translation initiation factor 2C
MPVSKEPFFQRYVSGVDNVEPLFRQLKQDRADLQLIVVVLPGKTPVYGK